MAHATVASLMRTMDSLLISNSPMESLICNHREDFHALREKVSSLEVFLKNFEKYNVSGEMTDFEVKVKEVANAVEHTIQLRLTETVMRETKLQKKNARRRFRRSLQQVAEDIDRVCKESIKIQDKGKRAPKESLVQDSSSKKHTLNAENNMVGRDGQRNRMLAELTGYGGSSGGLRVIPIIGMGGIGKTTLAKEVYNDASIRLHFDVRSWATVSQQHNVKEIFLSLLRSLKDDTSNIDSEVDLADLADMLQKSLKGKRYLIVLDDMWKSKAWDGIRLCFPSENNGSRILVTTRNTEVACYAGTGSRSLQMDLMGPDESWKLFESIAFFDEALASEFETIGKQIVDKCHGLPLTIVVVAGLLKSKRTIEYWENVAENVKSITNGPDKQCLDVLGLSYNDLTGDLKACLLYFGFFPEDSEVSVKRLMRLWIAEGFLNLKKDLEREAEKCLQELVDRCLVLVSEKSRDETRIRSCKVHDLIHDLCLREVQRGNVFLSTMKPFKCWTDDEYSEVLLTPGYDRFRDDFKLLKVLDLSCVEMIRFPQEILSLVWLRYLALCQHNWGNLDIPPGICRLWNLQTFIVEGYGRSGIVIPEQIWGLMQLRHLKMETNKLVLPNCPSISVDKNMGFANIQTISWLSSHCCTKEVIFGIQNVKKLGICGIVDEDRYESFCNNLVHLHQLESLSLNFFQRSFSGIPSAKLFPATLKKLKLEGTELSWSYLDIVAELPNLEVLKLMKNACDGEEWDPIVRGFTRLKILLIDCNSDLQYWKATNDNFPVLERLFIRYCPFLKEIPIEFADIYSLQLIQLEYCSLKLETSAEQIQLEQEDLGNNPVVVRITRNPWWSDPNDDDDDGNDNDGVDLS